MDDGIVKWTIFLIGMIIGIIIGIGIITSSKYYNNKDMTEAMSYDLCEYNNINPNSFYFDKTNLICVKYIGDNIRQESTFDYSSLDARQDAKFRDRE
jgi:hypothetical protein